MERAKFPTVPETTIDPLHIFRLWYVAERRKLPPIPSKTEKKGAWNFDAKEPKEKPHRSPVEETRSRFSTRCFS